MPADLIAYYQGSWAKTSQLKIPITDHGFLYGDAIFTTMRAEKGQPIFWEQHMERLERTLTDLEYNLAESRAELRQIVAQLLKKNKLKSAYIRLTISRGSGPFAAPTSSFTASLLAVAKELSLLAPKQYASGVAAVTYPYGSSPLAAYKTTNFLHCLQAKRFAKQRGAYEAILCDASTGIITEGSSSNLFMIADGQVLTPGAKQQLLPGVMRRYVLEQLASFWQPAIEQIITVPKLLAADAAFITNSIIGILPLAEVDAQKYPPHPLVAKLQTSYAAKLSCITAVP